MKAAVIGLGVVGQAQVRLFGGMTGAAYDINDRDPYPFERIAGCDFAVVCVGTPPARDGSADLSHLRDALGRLPPEMPLLIRSTIPPGTMQGLEKTRPCVAHLPEFLNERHDGAWRESADVPFAVLGGNEAAHEFFLPVLKQVLPCPISACTGLEAELVKYTANTWLAAQVTFANEMARVCAAFGADWETVRECWLPDPRSAESHTKIEGPGFGGRCLPKDIAALIAASKAAGYEPGFLEAITEANARFRRRGD